MGRLKHVRGDPKPEYTKDCIRQAHVACSYMGAGYKELARLFGITTQRLHKWLVKHDALRVAVREGMDYWNIKEVEASLAHIAKGYDYVQTTTKKSSKLVRTRSGKSEVVPLEEVTTRNEHVSPNVTAIMFFLQNRNPERWKNVRHVEANVSGVVGVEANTKLSITSEHLSGLTDEELRLFVSIVNKVSPKPEDGAIVEKPYMDAEFTEEDADDPGGTRRIVRKTSGGLPSHRLANS